MSSQKMLQQCVSDCRKVMSDLQSFSGNTKDIRFKSTLDESAHHLDMCVRECEFAIRQAP